MKHKKLRFLPFILIVIVLGGCQAINNSSTTKDDVNTFETITANEAKEMMDNDNSLIILDVRTEEEYITGHIENALLLPYTEISDQVETVITDKNTIILIYCRSGRRSLIAANSLIDLGYKNVYDFGGIIDWTYGIVTD